MPENEGPRMSNPDSSLSSDPATWVGITLSGGRYQIRDRLGKGGMAHIYRAIDLTTHTEVVVKVPKIQILRNEEFCKRFVREINAMRRLAHPHIVRMLDMGEHLQVPYFVLELLTGGSLRDRQPPLPKPEKHKHAPLPPEQLFDWLEQIASALDFMHQHRHIHRDIKPDNILFDGQGRPYISDFGIAKVIYDQPDTTQQTIATMYGATLGTPRYMAPELILAQEYDERIDQYALGITTYEILAGHVPYDGANPNLIWMGHQKGGAKPLSELSLGISKALSDAVLKSFARKASQRYPNCLTMARTILAQIPRKSVLPLAGSVPPPTDPQAETQPVPLPPPTPAGSPGSSPAKAAVMVSPPTPAKPLPSHTPPAAAPPAQTPSAATSAPVPDSFNIACPVCRQKNPVQRSDIGKRIECLRCRSRFYVDPRLVEEKPNPVEPSVAESVQPPVPPVPPVPGARPRSQSLIEMDRPASRPAEPMSVPASVPMPTSTPACPRSSAEISPPHPAEPDAQGKIGFELPQAPAHLSPSQKMAYTAGVSGRMRLPGQPPPQMGLRKKDPGRPSGVHLPTNLPEAGVAKAASRSSQAVIDLPAPTDPRAVASASSKSLARPQVKGEQLDTWLVWAMAGLVVLAAFVFALLSPAPKKKPDPPDLLPDALAALREFDPFKALPLLEEVLRLQPQRIEALQARAEAHRLAGDPLRAIADASAAIEADPQQGLSWQIRARARSELGRVGYGLQHLWADDLPIGEMAVLAEGLADLDQAVQYGQNNAHTVALRAEMLWSSGATRSAEALLSQTPATQDPTGLFSALASWVRPAGAGTAVPKNPLDNVSTPEAALVQAVSAASPKEIIERLDVVMARYPKLPRLRLERAAFHLVAGQDALAVSDSAEVLKWEANSHLVSLVRGESAWRRYQSTPSEAWLALAINHWADAIRRYPQSAVAHWRMGLAYQQAKQTTLAQQAFDRAVELAPQWLEARCARALLWTELGKANEALAELSSAIATRTDSPRLYTARALVYRQLQRPSEAEADQQKAQQLAARRRPR